MTKLHPTSDWMLVEIANPREDSGLALPETSKDNAHQAESAEFRVVAVNTPCKWLEGMHLVQSTVRVGDVVILEGGLAVAKFKHAGEDVLAARARDIAFIVEREKEVVADELPEAPITGNDWKPTDSPDSFIADQQPGSVPTEEAIDLHDAEPAKQNGEEVTNGGDQPSGDQT